MENTAGLKIISDLRQSAPYAKYIRSIGWRVITVDNTQVFIRSLGILGAIAKIQRVDHPLSWNKINKVLKENKVWIVKLEPRTYNLVPPRFHPDKWPLLATKTLRIDLTPPLQIIKARFKKDARYSLRKVQGFPQSGIPLRGTKFKVQKNNFGGFYELWKKSAKIKKLWIPPKKHFDSLVGAFGKDCFCITIDNLAGALILIHDRIAYYYYAAALPEAKKLYLPYFVVLELIKKAKKLECKIWDWEGIYDERWPNKSWQGFTHFKKSFGGYEVSFPGSFTRWF